METPQDTIVSFTVIIVDKQSFQLDFRVLTKATMHG